MDQKTATRLIGALVNGKFNDLWSGDELRDFRIFMVTQGLPAGAFVITFPICESDDPAESDDPDKKGFAWFCYRVKNARIEKGHAHIELESSPKVFMRKPGTNLRECPEQLKGLPVWRFNPPDDPHKPSSV